MNDERIISDQMIYDYCGYITNKVCDDMMNSMKSVRNQRISDPVGEIARNHRITDME